MAKTDFVHLTQDGVSLLIDGLVAIAKRAFGSSTAWYQGTELTNESQMNFFADVAPQLGIHSEGGNGVEVRHRGPYRFEIDHNSNSVRITQN